MLNLLLDLRIKLGKINYLLLRKLKALGERAFFLRLMAVAINLKVKVITSL